MKKSFAFFIAFALCGCSTGLPIQKYNNLPASVEAFHICHGYSCTHKSAAGFTAQEWAEINKIFNAKPAKDAAAERSKIGQAIALMERYSGIKTGTDEDNGEAVGFKTSDKQMDCIDETVNTTQYVGLLQNAGFLKFHEKTEPTHRGYIINGTWPHNTAVIREKENGALWAVDSFYRANGEEPYIVPRADWLNGWKPAGAKQ
ncbi:MAG: hypothetical protein DI626_00515 [Micavibrio aeruginosavorus]|uniref:Lipoprotein n=1 Tax=Micavibrio aeruginosavorus TaxID=349221 RepID=A0A2W5A6N6_9BACT|nr:MAG: hypothetical protein DI626_00515 [Micavibrio aeruginosavorus]